MQLFLAFAGLGAIIVGFYIFNRWIVDRHRKNKPLFKGIAGVFENGVDKWRSSSGNFAREAMIALIGYLVFVFVLYCAAFNKLPQYFGWLG